MDTRAGLQWGDVATMTKKGQILTRADGATVRIDRIANGQVYYVAWRANQDTGSPKRKPIEEFKELCIAEGMS